MIDYHHRVGIENLAKTKDHPFEAQEVVEGLFLGAYNASLDSEVRKSFSKPFSIALSQGLNSRGIMRVLSVGVEFIDPPTHDQRVGVQYLVIKTMDRPNFNLKDYFQLTNDFIHNSEAPVLVHWYRYLCLVLFLLELISLVY